MRIDVKRVSKRWGNVVELNDVSIDIASGSLVALLGPSGSGKTTLLRVIARLEDPDSGSVLFDGRDTTHTGVRDRGVGFVFQHYALFRHMTVFENIAFGLRVLDKKSRPPEATIEKRVHELLSLVQLEGLAQRHPAQLSGGQRQRVALARALAVEPKVLLLDEPFGALDAKVREELRRWLRKLHDELHVTSVFVTHDQEEALEVSDRVVVLNRGVIEQDGTPTEILDTPASAFVNEFVGEVNVLTGVVRDGHAVAGPIRVPAPNVAAGQRVRLLVRIYDLKIWKESPGIGVVERTWALGDRVKVAVSLDDGQTITGQFPRRSSLLRGVEAGARVQVEITLGRVYAGGQSLGPVSMPPMGPPVSVDH